MDGYIKKSEAVDVIVKYPYEIAGKTATAIKMIEDLPSADVVPKSEVESIITLNSQLEAEVVEQRKEIERLKKYNTDVAFKHYNDGKTELAREIFEEIEKIIDTYGDEYGTMLTLDEEEYAALKKKYGVEQ
jgi:phage shock protein A